MQPTQESPLTVPQTLGKLLARETVQVELIPEKKGLFLKHVEYQITSQHFKISVYRRYTDFDVFHELLLQRFAYRMVPALPPKRMLKGVLTSMSERDFIEGRRRALGRFINLVARHPFFSEDELVKTFLTFNGSDVQVKMRDACKKMGDEFMTNTMATLAKDLCERHEKGVLHEHQRALQKYGMMKRQMMSATVQPKEQVSVEQLESRIVQQENAIQTMELRNYFSLFCLHQETQLIFTYLPITSHILGAFVNSQVQGHQEMGAVWNDLQQKLGCLFGVDEMQSPPLTPK